MQEVWGSNSRLFENSSVRFGSVRFGSENVISRFDAVRPAFFSRVVARSGSVRFRVRFRPVPESNGPVRFGFLLLPDVTVGSGVHKGGGVSNLCVIIILLLLNPLY